MVNSKILVKLVPNLKSVLEYHSGIIGTALKGVTKPLSSIVLVEYGGGLGFQSLLARQLGVGTIVYVDTDPKMCLLAEEIAKEANLKADHYICGDQDTLVEAGIKADVITSNDVLEHIYNVDYSLSRLSLICRKDTVMVLNSGANMFWYPYAKHSAILQKQAEYQGVKEYGTGPFLQERVKIVKELVPGWSEDKVEEIAFLTRGLIQDSMALEIEWHQDFGHIIKEIDHPTNTCNPYTGNWAERSMNPFYLKEVLEAVGFEVKVLPVPYEMIKGKLNNVIRKILNMLIWFEGSYYGLCFSCRYSIQAKYTGVPTKVRPKQSMYKHSIPLEFYLVKVIYELVSLIYPRKSYYSSQFGKRNV